jgi:sodium/pantothenate symporter
VLWPVVYFAGTAVAVQNPNVDPPEQAMIWAALNLMPKAAGALLLAGILSAGLSSASTFLSLTGFSITNDVLQEPGMDEQRRLRLTRITVLGVGLGALLAAALVPPRVFWITTFVAQVFAACWGPVAFMSIWSRNITEAGAFWGMVAGFVSFVTLRSLILLGIIDLPVYLHPILIGALASYLTAVFISRYSEMTEAESRFLSALHQAPAELSDARAAARTMIWPKLLIAWGAVITVGLVFIWVHPYQRANGMLEGGAAFVVWSGELLLALLFGGLVSLGGAIAHWSVKRFYASGV